MEGRPLRKLYSRQTAPRPEPQSHKTEPAGRASAIARAKAQLAGQERALQLTDVREIVPAELITGAAGQSGLGGDDQGAPQHAVSAEEASAIVAHFAEHDPTLVAEVITQWIKADVKHEARPPL